MHWVLPTPTMVDAQLEHDEALARALQDEEDSLASRPLRKRSRRELGQSPSPEARPSSCGALPTFMLTQSPLGRQEGLCIESYGTRDEPLFVARNVDGERGEIFQQLALADLQAAGMQRPEPHKRGERQAVVVEMFRRRGTKHPWRTGLRMEDLNTIADRLLEELSEFCPGVQLLESRGRGWNDTEVVVYNHGAVVGRHRDAQPKGSLLFIFCAGLASHSAAWPDGGSEVQLRLESGDVMVLDGHTEHAVPESGIAGTSPFPAGSWLGQRRMAILVRQRPPA